MTPARLQKLKYVASAVALKVPYECVDRLYVGLEHIVSWTGQIQVDPNAEPEGMVSLFEPGDILFGKLRPYLAKVALADFAGASSTEALVLRPGKAAWPPYLRYVLSDRKFIDEVNASTFGAKMPRASWDFIGSRKVPTPDIQTQKAIVNFLDQETGRINQLIEKKQQLVQLLQAKLENDTLRLLTRGDDSHARMVDEPALEWIAERPEHWSIHRLKHFFRENTRYSVDGEEVLYSLRMNEGLVPHNDVSDKVIPSPDLVGYKKISPGQIVMNRMRAAIGLFGLADAEGIVSPDYSVFDVSKTAHPAYFLRLFKTAPMMTAFRILSKGLGTGQSGFMRLNADRFGEVRVAVPGYDEQRKISDVVERRIEQVVRIQNTTEHSVELLKGFRAALITAAVTGQIDVETWGKRDETDRRLDQIEEDMAGPRAAGQVEARA